MQGRVGECLYQAERRFGRGHVNGEEKLEAFKGQRVSFSWLFIPGQRYPPTTGRCLEITYVNLITRNFPSWAGEGLGSKHRQPRNSGIFLLKQLRMVSSLFQRSNIKRHFLNHIPNADMILSKMFHHKSSGPRVWLVYHLSDHSPKYLPSQASYLISSPPTKSSESCPTDPAPTCPHAVWGPVDEAG